MALLAASLAERVYVVVALVGLAMGHCALGRSAFRDHAAHPPVGQLARS